MGELVGNIVPLALGIAISPVPIIAVILMLSSKGALANAILFDAGWLFAIAGVSVIFLVAFGSSTVSGKHTTSIVSAVVHLVFGVLLLALALRKFLNRRKGVPEKQPKLLASIEGIKPLSACAFGIAMIVVNPKNLIMLVSALTEVIQGGHSTATNVAALAIFMVVASIGVLLPLAIYAIFRQKAASILASWNTWLTAHNSAVMMYLFGVLGVFLVVKGIVGLV